MAQPKAAIVVLNWNRPAETLRCLDSLRALTYAADALVVDNGSTDGSASSIRSARPEVALLETGKNLGYAGGNNVGIREALARGAEFVLVLNNDTVVQSADLIERLLAAAERFPRCGAVGPAMIPMDEPEAEAVLRPPLRGRIMDRLVFSALPGVRNGRKAEAGMPHQASRPRIVPSLTGFALGMFRPMLEETGGFDERFFLYDEEHDLCLRAAARGYCSVWAPSARVLRPADPPRINVPRYKAYYLARNRFFTARRFPFGQRIALVILHLVAMADLALTLVRTGQRASLPFLFRGLRDGIAGRGGPLVLP